MLHLEWIGSPNYKPLSGVKKQFAVLHWMVGNLRGTDLSFSKRSFGVATTFGIEDEIVHQYVKESDFAFGSGTSYANTYGISIEHSGGNLVNGKRRTPSGRSHETSSQLLAELSERHGWGALEVGRNVFGHSHFVPTECPGTLNIAAIVGGANEVLNLAPDSGNSARGVDWSTMRIVVDGVFGRQTICKLQWALGFRGDVFIDGVFGPVTIRALQKQLGQVADGYFGPISVRALQRVVGAVIDGTWGTQTTTALQKRLNSGHPLIVP